MELQRVGQCIILIKQCLADGWYPLVGIGIEVAVYGLSRPQGDVVQVDQVIVGTSIDQGTQLTVADGQRLLEEGGRLVVLQNHRRLFCLSFTKGKVPY